MLEDIVLLVELDGFELVEPGHDARQTFGQQGHEIGPRQDRQRHLGTVYDPRSFDLRAVSRPRRRVAEKYLVCDGEPLEAGLGHEAVDRATHFIDCDYEL